MHYSIVSTAWVFYHYLTQMGRKGVIYMRSRPITGSTPVPDTPPRPTGQALIDHLTLALSKLPKPTDSLDLASEQAAEWSIIIRRILVERHSLKKHNHSTSWIRPEVTT